jgi:hypothetical protein
MTNAKARPDAPHEPRHEQPHEPVRETRAKTGGTGGGERVTVNLTAKAKDALYEVAHHTDDTKTDTINRALIIYAYLERIMREGGKVYVRESGSDDLERVRFL